MSAPGRRQDPKRRAGLNRTLERVVKSELWKQLKALLYSPFSRCDSIFAFTCRSSGCCLWHTRVHRVRTGKCNDLLPQTVGAFGIADSRMSCLVITPARLHE